MSDPSEPTSHLRCRTYRRSPQAEEGSSGSAGPDDDDDTDDELCVLGDEGEFHFALLWLASYLECWMAAAPGGSYLVRTAML